jgi:hypothetical protein
MEPCARQRTPAPRSSSIYQARLAGAALVKVIRGLIATTGGRFPVGVGTV